MNYYEKNLGDYAKEAGHLSMAEHGALNLLLDYYFAREQPIPGDQAHKIARARTPEERAIVDSVLSEFFQLGDDGRYHRHYCDEILMHFKAGEPVRIVKKSNEAGRQKKWRDERARMFAALNAVGQYPDWNIKQPELRKLFSEYCTETLPDASRNVTGDSDETLQDKPATRDSTATNTHSPFPNNQTPIPNTQSLSLSQSEPERENVSRETSPEETFGNGQQPTADAPQDANARKLTPEAAMSIELRNRGVKVTSMHPTLVAWVQDGYTVEHLLGALAIARTSLGEDEEVGAKYLDKCLRDKRNWPAINRPKPNGANGHAGPARRSGSMTHADVMAALDAAVDPSDRSEDFA